MKGINVIDTGTLTVSNASAGVGMTDVTWNSGAWSALKTRAHRAMITVESAAIRYWADGTAPTTTTGHPVYKDDIIDWREDDKDYISLLENLLMIRDGAADATIMVTLYD